MTARDPLVQRELAYFACERAMSAERRASHAAQRGDYITASSAAARNWWIHQWVTLGGDALDAIDDAEGIDR